MSNRTTLTKSLHTVTAVSRIVHTFAGNLANPADAVRYALGVLGQPSDWPESDPTFAACVAKVRAMRGAS